MSKEGTRGHVLGSSVGLECPRALQGQFQCWGQGREQSESKIQVVPHGPVCREQPETALKGQRGQHDLKSPSEPWVKNERCKPWLSNTQLAPDRSLQWGWKQRGRRMEGSGHLNSRARTSYSTSHTALYPRALPIGRAFCPPKSNRLCSSAKPVVTIPNSY